MNKKEFKISQVKKTSQQVTCNPRRRRYVIIVVVCQSYDDGRAILK
jgi:hypothetical protein